MTLEISKVSDITVDALIEYIKTDESPETRAILSSLLAAARGYIRSQTKLTDDEIDSYPEFVVAVYIICQDWHDNRTLYVDKGVTSPTVEAILNMHSRNLL